MRRKIVGCILLLCFFYAEISSAQDKKVEKGIFDLRELNNSADFTYQMNGEWEFYYNHFFKPGDSTEIPKPDCYSSVPSYWTKNNDCQKKIEGTGHATYACTILLPSGFHDALGFDVPVFATSYEMFINGAPVARNGKPGENKYESTPSYFPLTVKYIPKSDTLRIAINVSNYETRRGGFWLPVKIGSYNEIQRSFSNHYAINIASSGMLLASFFCFIIFFLFDRKNKKTLAFSVLILTLAIRPLFTSPYVITLFTSPNWYLVSRAEYINLFVMLLSGLWFVHYLSPTRLSTVSTRFASFLFAFLILSATFLPVIVVSYLDPVINTIAFCIIGYAIVTYLQRVIKKNWIDSIYFMAIMIMAYGIFSDIRLYEGKEGLYNFFITPFTMVLFTAIHSLLLIKEWVKNSKDNKRLNMELEFLTKHLEERINERTSELEIKNTEIENQNKKIIEQNKKLSDTVHVKNQLFAVISHDLRSPIVSILTGLNLIKEDKTDENKEILANACIQNSQMAITLLENMLVWGRGQEDMIRYSPAKNNLADIILTNMSIYKDSADIKGISLKFIQVGNSNGWFDKDLMDIIIRNLISNAIKFTNPKGDVYIVLNESEESDDGLIFKITDNGVGIPEEKLETLFNAKSVHSTFGTNNEKGTGIGLRLVYELVKISHSTISVESTVDVGTCFTISLSGSAKSHKKILIPDSVCRNF